MTRNYYEILEVHPRASQAMIKMAYMTKKYGIDPDQIVDGETVVLGESFYGYNKAKPEESALIEEAYRVLSDEASRQDYDAKMRVSQSTKIINGEYKIIKEISEDAIGTLYLAEHVLTGDKAFIKHCHLISPEMEEAFITEAKILWNLRHSYLQCVRNILRMEDGSLAMVLSYIGGPTLSEIVEKNGPLEAEEVAWITERILSALCYLHYSGVAHGDIRPQNIIVLPWEHTIGLTNFSFAVKPSAGKTRSTGFSKLYSSPEQRDGLPLLPESDFFSLGKTAMYMLGGLDGVKKNSLPGNLPIEMATFIRGLVLADVERRPKWSEEDLVVSMQKVRKKSFGRIRTDMKPISGFEPSDY